MRALVVALLALLALALAPAAALGAQPRASFNDVEDEVMCDTCNVPLNIAESDRADQERAEIRRLIAQGLTKQQILADLERTYGPAILAKPQDSGFSLAVWWVPVAVVAGLAALLAALLPRWRRRRARPRATGAPAARAPDHERRRRAAPRRGPREVRRLMSARGHRPRHHRHRRVRGRPRLLHLALRAAARARLPVGGLGRERHRHPRGPPHPPHVLGPAIIFCLSFTVMFVALGMTATGLGSTLRDSKETLDKVAGILIVAMGVFFLLTPFVPRLNQEWRPDALIRRAGTGGPIIAGLAFAVAWTPCVGPTLASILAAASTSDTVAHGGVLLAFYSLGLAVPFLLTASPSTARRPPSAGSASTTCSSPPSRAACSSSMGTADPHRRAHAAQRPGPEGAEQPGPGLPLQDLAVLPRTAVGGPLDASG